MRELDALDVIQIALSAIIIQTTDASGLSKMPIVEISYQ